MEVQAQGLTDVGCKRDHNEDAYVSDPAIRLFAVCDGLGGHAAGEVASHTACEIVRDHIRTHRNTIDTYGITPTITTRNRALQVVTEAVEAACQHIYQQSQADPYQRGMGCTIALAVLTEETAIIAHVGDSRVYLVRQQLAHLLTEDHSRVAEQFRKGQLSAAEVSRSPGSSALTRALGIQPEVEIETLTLELADGDRLILCSDGLSDLLTTHEISEYGSTKHLPSVPRNLVDLANTRGGYDNITVIAVEVGIREPRSGMSVEQRMHALRNISLFEHLSFVELTKVMNLVVVESYRAGDRIIADGEPGRKLFVCMNGSVDVIKNGQTLTTLESGSFFGEMALIDNAPRSADVITRTDLKVITLDREDFYRLIRTEPHLAVRLLWALCRVTNARLRSTSAELSWAKGQLPDAMPPEVAALFELTMPKSTD